MAGEDLTDTMMDAADATFVQDMQDAESKGEGTEDNSDNSEDGQGQDSPDSEGQEENKPDDDQGADKDEDSQAEEDKEPTTEDDDPDKAKPDTDDGALPENLKPFEKLITAKGGLEKVLQSYQDAEKNAGNRGREVGLLNDRNKAVENTLLSDAGAINKYRESKGLSAIPFDAKSIDDKIAAHTELTDHLTKAINDGNQDSVNWLNNMLTNKRDDLRLDKRDADRNTPNTGSNDLNANAVQNKANLQSQNTDKDLNEIYDSIFKDPTLDALFQSFNVGPFEMMQSPDRAAASFELAQMVHKAKNFDAAVKAEVSKQMEANRGRKNASTPGSQGNNSASATENNPAVSKEGIIANTKDEFEYMSDGNSAM